MGLRFVPEGFQLNEKINKKYFQVLKMDTCRRFAFYFVEKKFK